jgi:hypothetical protein
VPVAPVQRSGYRRIEAGFPVIGFEFR